MNEEKRWERCWLLPLILTARTQWLGWWFRLKIDSSLYFRFGKLTHDLQRFSAFKFSSSNVTCYLLNECANENENENCAQINKLSLKWSFGKLVDNKTPDAVQLWRTTYFCIKSKLQLLRYWIKAKSHESCLFRVLKQKFRSTTDWSQKQDMREWRNRLTHYFFLLSLFIKIGFVYSSN